MKLTPFFLACLACTGQARTLQSSTRRLQSSPDSVHFRLLDDVTQQPVPTLPERPLSRSKGRMSAIDNVDLLKKFAMFLLSRNPAAAFAPLSTGIHRMAGTHADKPAMTSRFSVVQGVQHRLHGQVRMKTTSTGSSVPDGEIENRPPSFAELLKFTLFAMPIYVSPTLLSLIDTAVVGQVSAVQLAALGPACAICDGTAAMMVFISVGTTNAVSTYFGNSDMPAAKRAASVSAVMSFAIGCLIAVLLRVFVGPLIDKVVTSTALAGVDAAAATQFWASCIKYVEIRSFSFPAALLLMSAQASCLGVKDSTNPTVATLFAALVNIVGDAILVLGPLSMGIAGAAWATVGCQYVAACLLVRTLWRKGLMDMQVLRKLPSRQEVKRFFAFGAFIIVLVAKQVVYNQGILLATILGTAAGGAHQCLFSIFKLCCTIGDVTGATAQSFLPQYYVTDEKTGKVFFDAAAARGTIKRIVAMTALVAACNTAITFAIPLLRPGLLAADQEVAKLIRRTAPLAAAGLLLHPSVVGMEGCLLATKDIRWLVTTYVMIGMLSVVATQLLLKVGPLRSTLDMNAIWLYLAAFQVIRFVMFMQRLLFNTVGGTRSK